MEPDEGGLGVIFSRDPRWQSMERIRMDRRWTEEQSWQLLTRLFPRGLEDALLLQALAPEGWERSPLRFVFHPTLDQVYEEAVRFHTNIRELMREREPMHETPPPSLDEIRREYQENPLRPREECADLLGRCLWCGFRPS